MNPEGIDLFVRVARAGSFSRAARQLGMPVTTLSGKIAALEKRLGVTLLLRTTRKLSLSAAGESYLPRCEKALEELEAGQKELLGSREEPRGRLRITAPIDMGHSVLPPILRGYLRRHPRVTLDLVMTNRVVDLVGEGIDLAIRVGELRDSSLIARKFMDSTASAWASPAYLKKHGSPNSPKQLADHPLIVLSALDKKTVVHSGKERATIAWPARITADDFGTLKTFVLQGDGIGLMPNYLCEADERAGRLVRVLTAWSWGQVKFSFVYPPQRFVSPNVQSFIDWAITAVGK